MRAAPRTVLFEIFQEPMGGSNRRKSRSRSALSTWTKKRGLSLPEKMDTRRFVAEAAKHYQPFAWLGDPLNVLQTAVHFAVPRAHDQSIVVLPPETLRVNHYVNLGSNRSRCEDELETCDK